MIVALPGLFSYRFVFISQMLFDLLVNVMSGLYSNVLSVH